MRGAWRSGRVALALAIATVAGACGGSDPPPAVDAGLPPDARVEVRENREIVSGGTRLRGGSLTMDAELGHGIQQIKVQGGSLTVEGAAVVKP